MSNNNLSTLKGFRDFLPYDMAIRNRVTGIFRNVFEKYGFDEIMTPSLEYQDVLLGKTGQEAEKLMYLFRDPGKREVGLRYDLTVPLARFVSMYHQVLPNPFRRYQIQPVWRAENTQKGRYREIYQCDIDIIGTSSPLSDAEVLAVINEILSTLSFADYKIRLNSRTVLFSSMEKAGVDKDKWLTTIQSIDKLDKKSRDEIEKELLDKGVKSESIAEVFIQIAKAKPDAFLSQVIKSARKLGVDSIDFDPSLARGLDYYTGPIFESVVAKPKIGSITGGGRFDKLMAALGGPDLPATGSTIGLDRIVDIIKELNLMPNLKPTKTDVLIGVFSQEFLSDSLDIAQKLRQNGVNCEVFTEDAKLPKQIKYASKKGVPYFAIIGPEEKKSGRVSIKNLLDGTQKTISLKDILKEFLPLR